MAENLRNKIIQQAWDLIQEDSKLKQFYFLPWLFSILLLTVVLVYQTIYTYVVLFWKNDEALSLILNAFHSGYLPYVIVIGGALFLIYILIMPTFEGGLVRYLAQRKWGEDEYISLSEAIGHGLYRFLPLFEYSNIFSQFKFVSVLNIYLFCLRFAGIHYIGWVNWAFLILICISTIINILFAYAKFEIILWGKKAFESLGGSLKMSILTLGTTVRLYFFVFFVNLRIIINFLVFLIFPIIFSMAILYITTKLYLMITLIFTASIFVILIIFLGYIGGVFDIFKTAIWYYAYLEGVKKCEEAKD